MRFMTPQDLHKAGASIKELEDYSFAIETFLAEKKQEQGDKKKAKAPAESKETPAESKKPADTKEEKPE